MYKEKKIIAIIPARSGSKGLKDKNIKDLSGKPLIAWTIEAAIESNCCDFVMVSTDSAKYAEISKKYNAQVPFLRSAENSSDIAGSWPVIEEVLANLNEKYDIVILLQPTSPLRTAQNIKEALDLFFKKNADMVISVIKNSHPVVWSNILPENLSLNNFIKQEYINKPRQELPQSYTLNGAIYIIKSNLINKNIDLYNDKSFAYIMEAKNSIDIDDEIDFLTAKVLLEEQQK